MKLKTMNLILGMGLAIVMFQNCAKVGFQKTSMSSADGENDLLNTPTAGLSDSYDESIPPLDATCKALVSGQTAIAYDAIASAGASEKNFAIQASNQDINYETIGTVSNGAAQNITVKARSIASVSSFAASQVFLNALKIDSIKSFSASQVVAVAHGIGQISNFAAKLCLSVQDLESLNSLASDMTVFGRAEGKQALIKEIRNVSAFVSLHEIDVTAISSGSLRLRMENGHINSLSSGAGTLYLVNSSVGSISNFAGTVHLYGNSSVGSSVSGAVRIIKH